MSNSILNHRVSGKGHPVLFLHGFLESMSMWDYLNFEKDFMRVEIDLPGHGNSSISGGQDMASMARKVIELMDSMDVERYTVVGHSMGGYVALELMKSDSRCERLVLLNSNFWTDNSQKKLDRERVASIVQKNAKLFLYEAIPNLFLDPEKNDEDVRVLLKEAVAISPTSIAQASLAMRDRLDNSAILKERGDQILIIQGVEDTIVPIEMMRESTKDLKVQYVELENCGHMGHIEQAEKVARLIEKFA